MTTDVTETAVDLNDPKLLDCMEFRAIAELPDDKLHAMMSSAEPRFRVWAAWALGMRRAHDFSPDVRAAIGAEPVAGVRRHLLVMLAGFGEVDIVAALARHDPDTYVRTTAARYVAELTVKHPAAFVVAEQLLGDAAEGVRAAVIHGLPQQVPPALERLLKAAHADASAAVREAAARRAVDLGDLASLRSAAFSDENASVRRRALKGLIDAGISELRGLDPATLKQSVEDLRTMRVRFSFEAIESLHPGPEFLDLIEPSGFGSAGRVWLLGLPPHRVKDYWHRVGEIYQPVQSIDDEREISALGAFLRDVETSLLGTPNADEVGSLVPWGSWSSFEAPRHELLALLREKMR